MLLWDRFTEVIQSRSREEWSGLPLSVWERFRSWAREHGEQAAVVGLVGGVAIVMLFKLFMFFIVVAGLCAFVIWELSVPEADRAKKGDS